MVETIPIRAKIKVFTEAEGGRRKTPIYNGYRPNHIFEYFSDGLIRAYMGQIEFIDRESLSPGEECEVLVKFLKVGPVLNYLEVGRTWFFNEAQHPIGKGVILEILE